MALGCRNSVALGLWKGRVTNQLVPTHFFTVNGTQTLKYLPSTYCSWHWNFSLFISLNLDTVNGTESLHATCGEALYCSSFELLSGPLPRASRYKEEGGVADIEWRELEEEELVSGSEEEDEEEEELVVTCSQEG